MKRTSIYMLLAMTMLCTASVLSSRRGQDLFRNEATAQEADPSTPPKERVKDKDNPNRKAARGPGAAIPIHPSDALEARLAKLESIEYPDAPLQDVVDGLGAKLGIPFVIDKTALEEMGIGTDKVVNCNLKGIRIDACLDLILGELELTWITRDGYVLITTPDKLSEMLEVRVYNCSDLIGRVKGGPPSQGGFGGGIGGGGGSAMPGSMPGAGMAPQGLGGMGMGMPGMGMGMAASGSPQELVEDFDSLIEVITTTIEPDSWDETGGLGSIQPHPGGLLVVNQDGRTQRRIGLLLDMMRQAKQAQPGTVVRER